MARKKRITIHMDGDSRVLDMGPMEIWDGADLALLRETLTQLIDGEKCRSVGVDMTYVKYIPSGFFGMLYDWFEKGTDVSLYSPQPHVRNMLWFRKFFEQLTDTCHRLVSETEETVVPSPSGIWKQEAHSKRETPQEQVPPKAAEQERIAVT